MKQTLQVGSLESLLPLEESIRRKTAQTDTDILRQTLLSDDDTIVADDQGRIPEGYRTRTGDVSAKTQKVTSENQFEVYVDGHQDLLDQWNAEQQGDGAKRSKDQFGREHYEVFGKDEVANPAIPREFPEIGSVFTESGTGIGATINPEPILSEPGTYKPNEVIGRGQGMLDLLGDKRAIQEFETRTATQADVAAGLADEVGDQFVAQTDSARQAGFDESGNFLGFIRIWRRTSNVLTYHANEKQTCKMYPVYLRYSQTSWRTTNQVHRKHLVKHVQSLEQADALTGDGCNNYTIRFNIWW